MPATRLRAFSAFYFGDALFEQSDSLFVASEFYFGWSGPVVEGAEHFGLHVAHLIDEGFAELGYVLFGGWFVGAHWFSSPGRSASIYFRMEQDRACFDFVFELGCGRVRPRWKLAQLPITGIMSTYSLIRTRSHIRFSLNPLAKPQRRSHLHKRTLL